jgi:hypothetical protein
VVELVVRSRVADPSVDCDQAFGSEGARLALGLGKGYGLDPCLFGRIDPDA